MLSVIVSVVLALFASAAFAGDYADAVSVQGDEIAVTEAAFAHIQGEALATIVMQAASAPVFDGEGQQIGYVLTDIDQGSVFETIGLRDYDIVLAIDGTPLVNPKIAVEALRYARGLARFDVKIRRNGVERVLRVRVGGTR